MRTRHGASATGRGGRGGRRSRLRLDVVAEDRAEASAGTDEGGGLPLWGWLLAALVVLVLVLGLLTRRTARAS